MAAREAEPAGPPLPIQAGRYPAELLAACRWWGIQPQALLDWALRPGEISLVLPNGFKVKMAVTGAWAARQKA